MKILFNIFKAGVLLLALNTLLLSSELKNPHFILIPKTEDAIINIANELYSKLNIHTYVYVLKSLDGIEYEKYIDSELKEFQNPYVFLFLSIDDKKIDIKSSSDLEEDFDKKGVYWDHIIPLLPAKESEITPQNVSAAVLNGYNEIAYQIAKSKNIELNSVMKNDYEVFTTLLNWAAYLMVGSLIVLLFYSYKKGRNIERSNVEK